VKLALDPGKPLGETFAFILPPTGVVNELTFDVALKGEGKVTFDVGCDGQPDGELRECPQTPTAAADVTTVKWTEAANGYLSWAAASHTGPYRDDSGWRIVPVRIRSDAKLDVLLSNVMVVVR
jgi:hypothetical protein